MDLCRQSLSNKISAYGIHNILVLLQQNVFMLMTILSLFHGWISKDKCVQFYVFESLLYNTVESVFIVVPFVERFREYPRCFIFELKLECIYFWCVFLSIGGFGFWSSSMNQFWVVIGIFECGTMLAELLGELLSLLKKWAYCHLSWLFVTWEESSCVRNFLCANILTVGSSWALYLWISSESIIVALICFRFNQVRS